MKEKTLIFFIDALREDYISKKYTPFLFDFKKNNYFLNLISQLGYSSGIHPSIWKGTHQENHGFFLVYSYDPKNSDFRWMKYLKIFPNNFRKFLLASFKAPYYLFNFKHLFPKWYLKKILPVPASIDPILAPFFKKEKVNYELDFFKLLNENKFTYSSQPEHDHALYGKKVPLKNWNITKNYVDFFFTYEIDPIGHYSGPNSLEIKNKMKLIDAQISKLVLKAKKKYSKVNIFIFSDHGMEEVIGNIDVKTELEKLNLRPIKDYIVFYDSTMVRFWVKNESVKKILIKNLSLIKNLTYLNDNLKNKYKINFKSRKWGDLFFLANPGYRIFPDNFAPVKFNTKGMHGYFPESKFSKGIFMSNLPLKNNEIKVIDILPTILSSLNIKIDKTKYVGKNILENEKI